MALLPARRGLVTGAGVYGSALLGIAGTVVAARLLGLEDFGRFALVVATVSFVQLVLDATGEEALVKYGFRYLGAGEPGRVRRLIRVVAGLKGATALISSLVLVAAGLASGAVFGDDALRAPLLVAALIPPLQSADGTSGALLFLRRRHDVRGFFLLLSMALRLGGIALAADAGVTAAVAGVVVAQAIATAAVVAAGWWSTREIRASAPVPLGTDRGPVLRFIGQSAVGSGLSSVRAWLPAVLLGFVSTPAQVGLLRVGQTPSQGFASLSAPVRMIMLTEQTRDWERGRPELVVASLRRYVLGAALVAALLVPPLAVAMPWLVELLFTADFLPAVDAARLVLIAAAVQLGTAWSKSLPISIGRPELRTKLYAAETAVLVPLVAVLGARWGATGAAAAVLVATLAAGAAWAVVLLRLARGVAAMPPGAVPADTVSR